MAHHMHAKRVMADPGSPTLERARELIEALDAMRRESETIRGQIEDAMRQDRPFWPERRRRPRGLTRPSGTPAP